MELFLAILSLTDEGKLETGMSVDWTWSSFYHNCSGMNKNAQNHTMMSSLFPPIYASQIFFFWLDQQNNTNTYIYDCSPLKENLLGNLICISQRKDQSEGLCMSIVDI